MWKEISDVASDSSVVNTDSFAVCLHSYPYFGHEINK